MDTRCSSRVATVISCGFCTDAVIVFSELTIGRCKFVRAEVVRRGGAVGGPEQQVRACRQREGQRSSNDRDEQEGDSARLASGVEPHVRGVERAA